MIKIEQIDREQALRYMSYKGGAISDTALSELEDGTLTLPNQYNQFKPHNCGFFCVKFSEFFRCMVLYFYFKYGII